MIKSYLQIAEYNLGSHFAWRQNTVLMMTEQINEKYLALWGLYQSVKLTISGATLFLERTM